jgi:hypothetical protein
MTFVLLPYTEVLTTTATASQQKLWISQPLNNKAANLSYDAQAAQVIITMNNRQFG